MTGSGPRLVEALDAHAGAALEAPPAKRSPYELNVLIVVTPQFPLLSLTGAVEALRHAGDMGDRSRKVRCSWTIASSHGGPVDASCGVPIATETVPTDMGSFDYLILIGGLVHALPLPPAQADTALAGALARAARQGTPIAAVCTGTFVLAGAGLLPRRRACVHPYHVEDFMRRFPGWQVQSDRDYLWDGDRITVPGGTSIIALMVDLVERHCGKARAAKAVHQMTLPGRRDETSLSAAHAAACVHVSDNRLQRALLLMERNLNRPLKIADMAAAIGVSGRQLTRLFTDAFGASPQSYYKRLRLEHGRWLIETRGKTVTEAAYRVGFSDCAHFCREHKRAFGRTARGADRAA